MVQPEGVPGTCVGARLAVNASRLLQGCQGISTGGGGFWVLCGRDQLSSRAWRSRAEAVERAVVSWDAVAPSARALRLLSAPLSAGMRG